MYRLINNWISKSGPIGFIDVGASGGLGGEWKKIEPYMHVIGFEPDIAAYEQLIKNNKANQTYINCAVSNSKEIKELFIRKNQGNSSFYSNNNLIIENFPYGDRFQVIDKTSVKTDTLDNLLHLNNIHNMDYLKVDVEGEDLNVIKGAQRTLAEGIFALQIEVRFIEFYKNEPLFSEVNSFITSLGFELFDLNRYYYKTKPFKGSLKGQLGMADALYFMDIEKHLNNCEKSQHVKNLTEKVLKAMIISALYGYYDYSEKLLDKSRDLFETKDYNSLIRDLKKCKPLSEIIPSFKGKGMIYRILTRLANLFLASNQGAFHSDCNLGNRRIT